MRNLWEDKVESAAYWMWRQYAGSTGIASLDAPFAGNAEECIAALYRQSGELEMDSAMLREAVERFTARVEGR